MLEKQQAEADKEVEDEAGSLPVDSELKPGERKVVADGSKGPVVEIIRKTAPIASSETSGDNKSEESGKTTEAKNIGE